MDTQLLIFDIDSRWCVRVLFLLMAYICPFILHLWHIVHFINGMMILVLAYKNGFKSKSVH